MAVRTSALFVLGVFLVATGCSSGSGYTPTSTGTSAGDTGSGSKAASTEAQPAAGWKEPSSGEATAGGTSTKPVETEPGGYLQDVFFDYDRFDVREDGRAQLGRNADWLRKNATVKVLVEGHCDERGTAQYNLALGEKRAHAVRDYLTSAGVDGARIDVVSYGKERPFERGSSEAAFAKNRRAHFVITAR